LAQVLGQSIEKVIHRVSFRRERELFDCSKFRSCVCTGAVWFP
jgi:hypothetical protein